MKNCLTGLVHLEVCWEDEWSSGHADSIMASVMKHICSVVKLSVQQLLRTLKRRDILSLDATCHLWFIDSLSEM